MLKLASMGTVIRLSRMSRMHHHRTGRVAPLLALLVVGLSQPGGAQGQGITPRSPGPPRDRTLDARSGSAIIVGRVYSAEDGTPLRGAEIQASGGNGQYVRNTLTDADGRFELGQLSAGRWSVSAAKAGFIAPRSNQRNPLQPVRALQVADTQRYTVDFAMIRGSAISGFVNDEYGEPVAGVQVEAVRSRIVKGTRQLTGAVTTDLTDDTGAFRLHSLPAGDYYVAATLRAAPPDEPGLLTRVGLPTYFPGTPNVGEAQRLTLMRGQDRSGVGFSVVSARAVRVSGLVLNSAGAPAQDASVELLSVNDLSVIGRPFGNFGLSQDGGRFTILNVPPGSYALSARVDRAAGAVPEVAFVPIQVGSEDVSGITVGTRRGTTLAGLVATVPGAALPLPLRLGVVAQSTRENGSRTARVDRTGAFSIAGLYGPHRLDVEDLPEGWMLKSVEVGGEDVTNRLLDFPADGRLAARVVVTNRTTAISGTVRSDVARQQDAGIVVFSADTARWTYPSRFVRAARVDAQGRFRIDALPPESQYLAVAVEQLDESDAQDPEFLERMRPLALSFSLDEGEKKVIDLVVVGP